MEERLSRQILDSWRQRTVGGGRVEPLAAGPDAAGDTHRRVWARCWGTIALGFPGPGRWRMQGEAAWRAGDLSRQREDPSPEGPGGYQLLTLNSIDEDHASWATCMDATRMFSGYESTMYQ